MSSARAAYAKAFMLLRKTSKDASLDDEFETSSEKALIETATEILSATPNKAPVSDFVNSLHHYHGVFDVLCQADFSYLSIIWGGMKLILIVSRNATLCEPWSWHQYV
jgi:hypothetical protein